MKINNIITRIKKRTAESLVEVVIAVFVIALGSGAATSLIVTALQSNSFSRDNLVALNLAVEGIEAMRNIRDTNWLKFGYDKANCWNVKPLLPLGTNCAAIANKIAGTPSYFTVDLNPDGYTWNMKLVGTGTANLDISTSKATNPRYQLGYVDVSAPAGDKDLLVTADYITSEGLSDSGDSVFYRMITVKYPGAAPLTDSTMNVISTVQWETSGSVHQVELSTSLTNYQKVKVT